MAEEAAKESSPQSSGGGGKQSLILMILAVINMVVVGAVGFMIFKSRQAEKEKPTIDEVVQGEAHTLKTEHEESEKLKVKPVIPLETFMVNLAQSKGRRIAKVSIELEVSDEKVKAEIDQRQTQIRDIIIMLLSSKTYENVSTPDGKNKLREEIIDTVNAFLSKGKIESVYFTEFLYN